MNSKENNLNKIREKKIDKDDKTKHKKIKR